jgi:hypothetical protein
MQAQTRIGDLGYRICKIHAQGPQMLPVDGACNTRTIGTHFRVKAQSHTGHHLRTLSNDYASHPSCFGQSRHYCSHIFPTGTRGCPSAMQGGRRRLSVSQSARLAGLDYTRQLPFPPNSCKTTPNTQYNQSYIRSYYYESMRVEHDNAEPPSCTVAEPIWRSWMCSIC